MSWTKKVFTVIIFLKCINGNKYCAFEIDGEAKYYVCPKNEYCCNLGCCVNLAFQFYQMWYYWLLLILMFMVCSGGGWWYRFCRQPEGSSYPSMSTAAAHSSSIGDRGTGGVGGSASGSNHTRRPIELSNRRSTRLIHNMSLDRQSALYLQQIWKTQPNCHQPPNYYSNGSSVVYHHNGPPGQPPIMATDIESAAAAYRCPYYQLYGPPPSYESVVQLTGSSTNNEQVTCVLLSSSTTSQTTPVVSTTTTTTTAAAAAATTTTIATESTSVAIEEDQQHQIANDSNGIDHSVQPSTSTVNDSVIDCNDLTEEKKSNKTETEQSASQTTPSSISSSTSHQDISSTVSPNTMV